MDCGFGKPICLVRSDEWYKWCDAIFNGKKDTLDFFKQFDEDQAKLYVLRNTSHLNLGDSSVLVPFELINLPAQVRIPNRPYRDIVHSYLLSSWLHLEFLAAQGLCYPR